jgi:hypothetical protein
MDFCIGCDHAICDICISRNCWKTHTVICLDRFKEYFLEKRRVELVIKKENLDSYKELYQLFDKYINYFCASNTFDKGLEKIFLNFDFNKNYAILKNVVKSSLKYEKEILSENYTELPDCSLAFIEKNLKEVKSIFDFKTSEKYFDKCPKCKAENFYYHNVII